MKVATRKVVRSPLAAWLNANGMTMREFGRRIGIDHAKLSGIIDGRATPGIVVAYEVERLTQGEVSIESWLGLDIAKAAMAGLRAAQPVEFQAKSFRKEETDEPKKTRMDEREDAAQDD